ncbi:MAG: FMNH2-dependent monooxygenase [Mycobacterium sp.]|jgi:FMN-dependent oxidoreductase (nitrilotriacetate monooxygenase family)|nr:FMN-dependent oxidoreductase, nitrilotriacetate monooxygenase family [Mycobacterium sp.]MCW2730949.1 FMNH2-dependent monooxygenase [Mycobacterium sp.]MDT5074431.1 N-acetyl-S-(2-succino)cysteine monooxygenase [Mycobacterium sp.]MDT5316893.1 N-acetyl-S-(2-succino)cysteine monooxygenase [Mycobacterium sp.]
MGRMFHLGWFLNFVTDEWNGTWGDGGRDFTGDFYVEVARDLERAKFDYVLIEDKLMVSTAYGGTMEHDLKHGVNPKHDPVPLAVLMANATSRLGVVPTMSTSFYPPFLLARLASTIDHIARGRFGWNVVTSAEDRSAQNFGLDKLWEHDERYVRAAEYLELVSKLWESWEPDAVERDQMTGTFANFKKVHTVDFEGKYFKSRGPLNTAPSPQYRPTIAQAGASPPGRELAAKHADTIVTPANGVEEMKAYRDDIHARMEAIGRDPAHCKVLYLVSPIVADTHDEALAKRERWFSDPLYIEYMLAEISSITEIDFAQFDLDQPLPELWTNGERGALASFVAGGKDKTLRELVTGSGMSSNIPFVGTPAEVAEEMGDVMAQVGGDGFLITSPVMRLNRRYVTEITDGLIPELQRRGLARSEYTTTMLRDHLREF